MLTSSNTSSQNWLDWAENWYFWLIVKVVISIVHVINFNRNKLAIWFKMVCYAHVSYTVEIIIYIDHKVQLSVTMNLLAKTIIMPPKIILSIKYLPHNLNPSFQVAMLTVYLPKVGIKYQQSNFTILLLVSLLFVAVINLYSSFKFRVFNILVCIYYSNTDCNYNHFCLLV